MSILEGDLDQLPAEFLAKAIDGKGDYRVKVKVLSPIATFDGKAAVGRDHTILLNKVAVDVSRNGKTQRFIGTCTEELVTSCGGACADEDPNRDEL